MKRWTCWVSVSFLLGLLLLGCGGGSASTGGIMVTVSPKMATVNLTLTQQFFASVTGGTPPVVATIAASNGAVRAANVVTITTTSPHGLATGQSVTIGGVSDSSFNGTFTIASVPSMTTFTYPQTGSDATSGGGTVSANTVKWFVSNVEGGNTASGTISATGLYTAPATLPPATTLTIASNGAARTSNVVTITTTAAHNLIVGQAVIITGVTDASFNGTFTIQTVPSTTTFTYFQTAGNATSGGGMVTSTTVQIKAQAVADSTKSDTATVSVLSGISISISRKTATVGTTETFQFIATVTGSSITDVTWMVNGGSANGTISTSGLSHEIGLYAAPSAVPNPATVTITATAVIDPNQTVSASVTVVTAADPTLTAINPTPAAQGSIFQDVYLTGSHFLSTSTILLNDTAAAATIASGSGAVRAANVVTITTTSPHGLSTGQSVTISGVSDGSFNGTITIATVPFTTIFTYAQTGSDATSGGGAVTRSTVVPSSALTLISDGLLRARIPDSLLGTARAFNVAVERQSGFTTPPCTPDATKCQLVVAAVRPALVGASPDSATQTSSSASVTFNVNGGYFGTTASPVVTAEFDGNVRKTTVTSRQLGVTIGGGNGDLNTPGLFSVAVRNSGAAQPVAVANLAVQPSPSVTAPSVVTTLTMPGTNPRPAAVAVNTATGIAVVANSGTNTLTLIDLKTSPPTISGAPIAVGTSPTGVAVDTIQNLAVVANNGSSSLSVVNLNTLAVTPVSANINNAPFSVGINPLTGRALVAYQSKNNGSLLDLTVSPPVVIGSVSISTGPNPQVAVEPRLNWAAVTPGGTSGGGGSFSIVDLGRQSVNAIAASPNGASRSSNVVTITTTTTHGLIPNEAVLITGVTDASFNGTFTVSAVPSNTTFTYIQTGANATSGGGSVFYSLPLASFTLGVGVRGIGLNPVTEKALLTDPTTNTLIVLSLLDQSVPPLTLPETGAVAAAVNPLIDIGVTINPGTGTASVIDPRAPARIATVPVGAGPTAVAIDPASNLAVVANQGSNDVTIISLGNIRSPQIVESSPAFTFTSSTTPLTLTVTGSGFGAGSAVRLDGDATGVTTSFDSTRPRQLTATIAPSRLGAPRRYAVDVLNPGGVHSNVSDLTVIMAVNTTSTGCTAPAPRGVAIDPQLDLVVVTNPGCNNISLIDLKTATVGTVTKTIAVGTNPQGVAVISRLGKAVVTNRGSNNASVVDLAGGMVPTTVTVGTEPIGVAINQDTAIAVVANSASSTISTFSVDSGSLGPTASVDARPVAVAIDPTRNMAAVACATQNTVNLVDLSQASLPVTARASVPQLPTGVVFDPVSRVFLALSSLGNKLFLVNPDAPQQLQGFSVGINPTALAYNFQSSTLVIANTASQTVSVIDFLDGRIRAILGSNVAPKCLNTIVAGSPPVQQQPTCGVEIHPRTNLAVFADGDNNRVLLMPLPR